LALAGGSIRGITLAGLGIGAKDDITGITLAGIGSGSGSSVKGIAISGVGTGAGGSLKGLMIAGVGLGAGESMKGIFISGVALGAPQIKGLAIAGITAQADDIKGIAISPAYLRIKPEGSLKGIGGRFFQLCAGRPEGPYHWHFQLCPSGKRHTTGRTQLCARQPQRPQIFAPVQHRLPQVSSWPAREFHTRRPIFSGTISYT
jgi:hypothetical protein